MTVLASVAVQITVAGPVRPAYADILDTLNSKFQTIYGLDSYIDPDSQDGQFIAAIAKAVDDVNGAAVAVYNSFSPSTAQSDALSSNVKINGMKRNVPTNSTAVVRVTGTVGITIQNGVVQDSAGNDWNLPASVTIPAAGYADVTATCSVAGAVLAAAGTITNIQNPTLGWASASNAAPAVGGAPVESDAALRQRQAVTVALPAQSPTAAIAAAVGACAGVTSVRPYENDTGVADSNGMPAHSVCMVTIGGAAADICAAIQRKKGPGVTSFGSTSQQVVDSASGIPYTIYYTPAVTDSIVVTLGIKSKTGWSSAIGTQVQDGVQAFVNALGIGQSVQIFDLLLPARLYGGAGSETFEVTSVQIAINGGAAQSTDGTIAYNHIANCADPSDVVLEVS